MRRLLLLVAASGLTLAIAFGAVACGDDDDDDNGGGTPVAATATEPAGGTPPGEAGTVEVSLLEYTVTPDADSATAGDVTFNVSNIGGVVHEFVVVRTDLAAEDLPTAADGSFDEAGEGAEVVDEIEDIAIGDEPTLTVSLDAGNYLLLCNIVEETTAISHFDQGMHTPFIVIE
jgi:hypothetical protein